MKTVINKNERHALQFDGDHVYLIDLVHLEKVEILNYSGDLIFWDVYGECYVYDSGEDIEYKYIGKSEAITC